MPNIILPEKRIVSPHAAKPCSRWSGFVREDARGLATVFRMWPPGSLVDLAALSREATEAYPRHEAGVKWHCVIEVTEKDLSTIPFARRATVAIRGHVWAIEEVGLGEWKVRAHVRRPMPILHFKEIMRKVGSKCRLFRTLRWDWDHAGEWEQNQSMELEQKHEADQHGGVIT